MNYLCRTCLSPDSDEMESIFSIKCINDENVSISDMIALCVGIEISKHDNFTNIICKSCRYILLAAFNYRRTCWLSHKHLMRQAGQHQLKERMKDAGEIAEVIENEIENKIAITDKSFESDESLVIEEEVENNIVNNTTDHSECDGLIFIVEEFENSVENTITDNLFECDESVIIEDEAEDNIENAVRDKLFESDDSVIIVEDVENNIENTVRNRLIESEEPVSKQIVSDKPVIHAELIREEINYRGKRYRSRSCQHFLVIPNGFTCNICSTVCSLERPPSPSKQSAAGNNEFVCDSCGINVVGKTEFEIHLRKHTSEKPFKCKFCNFCSSHKVGLNNHQRTIHSTEKPFICHFCGKGFMLRSLASLHIATHLAPIFECVLCQKTYRTRDQYRRHMPIHDLSKHKACDKCDKTFARYSALKQHRQTHTGEISHRCKVCGKGFITRRYWRLHMRNNHNQIV